MDTEKTYTLDDLDQFEFSGTSLAVLGDPVRHSISPAMQNAALANLELSDPRFAEWAYYRFEIPAEALLESLPRFHAKGFWGLNLTVPHKVIALEGVEKLSATAQQIGAVNTLRRTKTGYEGFNTDGYGMEMGLKESLGVALKDNIVLLLGSGGAARAAAVQCLQAGCQQLYLGNRTPARLAALQASLAPLPSAASVSTFALAQVPENLPENGIVINATSLGLKESDPTPIDISQLPPEWAVYDMIYNPLATRLMQDAQKAGLKTANGLSMLVHQGARALEIWSKATIDSEIMQTAARKALQRPHK